MQCCCESVHGERRGELKLNVAKRSLEGFSPSSEGASAETALEGNIVRTLSDSTCRYQQAIQTLAASPVAKNDNYLNSFPIVVIVLWHKNSLLPCQKVAD